jgi:hypothetical protein
MVKNKEYILLLELEILQAQKNHLIITKTMAQLNCTTSIGMLKKTLILRLKRVPAHLMTSRLTMNPKMQFSKKQKKQSLVSSTAR